MTAAQIAHLRLPPSQTDAQASAAAFLAAQLSAATADDAIARAVDDLLASSSAEQEELQRQLDVSQASLDGVLHTSRASIAQLQRRADALQEEHLKLEDELIDQRNAFLPPDGQQRSLLRDLEELQRHLAQLERTRAYFAVLEQAETLSRRAQTSVQAGETDAALRAYTELVAFSHSVDTAGQQHDGPARKLHAAQLVRSIAAETWHALRAVLSQRLQTALDKAHWPAPEADPLLEMQVVAAIKADFMNLLRLQKTADQAILPHLFEATSLPLIAITTLAQPIILRFRYHFEGKRQTNRLDKPEWFFAHILNAISDQERFLTGDVQELLTQGGFGHIDALTDFITVLLDVVIRKLRHLVPQLLSIPPIFAHAIYQSLEFDTALRQKYDYRPRGSKGEWPGTVDSILGRQDWLDGWRNAEKQHADDRYYEIIGATDAWQINDDFGPVTQLRPTNSALRIRDLFDQITERYRSLPLFAHRLPFLADIQLPLLDNYHGRIASAIDAFETLSFGLMRAVPGALGDSSSNRLTAGVAGLQRVVRAGVSAKWMEGVCRAWEDDEFFLEMWQELRSRPTSDAEARELLAALGSAGQSSLFAAHAARFATLAERIDGLIVKHVVREVSTELKPYMAKKWDFESSGEGEDDLGLSPELASALATFQVMFTSLSSSLPLVPLQHLYRSTVQHLINEWLVPRLVLNRVFSAGGGGQLAFDLTHGWEAAGRQAGVRAPASGWAKLREAATLLALPASTSTPTEGATKDAVTIGKVSQAAWDGDEGRFDEIIGKGLGVEMLTRKEVQAVLKKRPEVWR